MWANKKKKVTKTTTITTTRKKGGEGRRGGGSVEDLWKKPNDETEMVSGGGREEGEKKKETTCLSQGQKGERQGATSNSAPGKERREGTEGSTDDVVRCAEARRGAIPSLLARYQLNFILVAFVEKEHKL
jgi:hypothetical protein